MCIRDSSVSAQGDGWLEFTIRSVGKVTNVIFEKEAGDTLFLRGPYGKGWPVEQFRGKHLVVITGGNLNVLNDTVMHSSLYYKAFNMFNPFL